VSRPKDCKRDTERLLGQVNKPALSWQLILETEREVQNAKR